jgi:hypothetical protein
MPANGNANVTVQPRRPARRLVAVTALLCGIVRAHLPVLVAIAGVACGGTSAPAGSGAADSRTIGVVEGTPFVVRTEFSSAGGGDGGAYPYIQLFLVSQDIPVCGAPQENGMVVSIFLYNNRDTTPLGPGVYPLWQGADGGTEALAYLSVYGPACTPKTWDAGSSTDSGTVTITAVGASIAGTFDLVASGVRLSGAFDAPTCVRDSSTLGDYCM